jgi:hypothetical protein
LVTTVGTMSEMRFFTPAEANEMLGLVRPLAERLVEARRSLVTVGSELEEIQLLVAGNGSSVDPTRVGELQEAVSRGAAEVASAVRELQDLGVQVKDIDRGLVDFPARHPESGDPVLLCWELGEPEVEHWHDLEAGFAGRKRLPF